MTRFLVALAVVGAAACSPAESIPPLMLPVPTHAPPSPATPTVQAPRVRPPPPHRRLARRVRLALDPVVPDGTGVVVGVSKRIVYSHEGSRLGRPASNQKLLLAMAVLDRVGPRHRISTVARGIVRNGVVAGDLWLVGHGDPSLRGTELRALAHRIAAAGVTQIQGSVLGDGTRFEHDFDAPGWQSYVYGRYIQLPTALVKDGNGAGTSSPEMVAAETLTAELERSGVAVAGDPGAGAAPRSAERIARLRSPRMDELLGVALQQSSNFFAEVLGKLLGAATHGAPGTISSGAEAIEAWAAQHGVTVRAFDSSGLSYRNRVSPRGMVELLLHARRKPWGDELRAALPAPGEGTLNGRLPGLDVRAKTGSLFDGTITLSGWLRPSGTRRWLAFSIMSSDGGASIDPIVSALDRSVARALRKT